MDKKPINTEDAMDVAFDLLFLFFFGVFIEICLFEH